MALQRQHPYETNETYAAEYSLRINPAFFLFPIRLQEGELEKVKVRGGVLELLGGVTMQV